jgi:hypothetical protein
MRRIGRNECSVEGAWGAGGSHQKHLIYSFALLISRATAAFLARPSMQPVLPARPAHVLANAQDTSTLNCDCHATWSWRTLC